MFLALDSHEQEIASAAAGFLDGEFPLQRLHGAHSDATSLAAFAELGWLGLSLPEDCGGSGLSIVEEMLFFLELGRVAGPLVVLSQILGMATVRGDAAIRNQLLRGETSVALLVQQGPDGALRFIGGDKASYALSVAPHAAVLYQWDAGACREVPCLDRSVNMYVGEQTSLKPLAQCDGSRVWRQAQVDVAAMLVGIAGCALDMIVAYAKVRQTFGRAIGAYQAVRHPCADMAVRVEAARCQLFYAATALKEGSPDAPLQVDAAKLLAVRAAQANTDANIQLHGGIGVTDEFSAHLLLKRANLLWRLFGSPSKNMQSLLDIGGKDGGEGANRGP